MSDAYVSDFPDLEKVNPQEVFSQPGYTDSAQKIPGVVITLFVVSLISFLVPVFLSIAALIVAVLAGGLLRVRTLSSEHQPGDGLLRAAFGLSFLSIGWGTVWFLAWVITKVTVTVVPF
ncbi:hypothetical protein [Mobiluncus curtisii]|uniref:DUF4190 domain-containing protein n=3 Tax=Mobiluncus curtisii TaxID=2051 RepID=D6ZJL6_MOBCV|nr:hypothetical protein [Mobiluncus curtisii]ADI66915.1 hypothetical protein HMPREF0573_10596 [Mobiluncus curtisii ATCC 43063]MCU9987270.1 hypothetical protein [Mobiluncus curtisii]MCV0001173.1 hypothetical protein [Mobiluncus curtisii]MCV0020250.1 hypothetical protein [Mobiluncus curtisii]NMW45276.1 hypothetical protein [Mobiluncus curtisii]